MMLALAALGVLVAALLAIAHRVGVFGVLALVLLLTAGVVFALDLYWMDSDPTGAGGAWDCWPSCSLEQKLASLGFLGPPLVAIESLLGWLLRASVVAGKR